MVYCDNILTIKLSKKPVMHGRSKYIYTVLFSSTSHQRWGSGAIALTQEQVVDIMAKPLKLEVYLKLRDLLGVCKYPEIN